MITSLLLEVLQVLMLVLEKLTNTAKRNVGRYDEYAWIDMILMSLNCCELGWEVVKLVMLSVDMLILVLMVAYVVVGDWWLRMLCVLRRGWDKYMFEMVGM